MTANRFKFRAWDDHNKIWLDPQLFSVRMSNGAVSRHGSAAGCVGGVTVEQSTGRADVKRNLSFEGDIIRGCLIRHELTVRGVIVWDAVHGWCLKNDGGNTPLWEIGLMEVIGNIHENPELLD